MLAFALGTGIISYILFVLGILGFYNRISLGLFSMVIVIFYAAIIIKYRAILYLKNILVSSFKENSIFIKICIGLILSILFLNLIITLSPERAFDALWYHLVIPQVYLQNGGIFYIPGSLLYYSPMPKLIDLLYVVPLAFNLDILTRMISFVFGISTLFVTYSVSRLFLNKKLAILSVVILLSNVVFSWQMTTAYIDMGRTFFETISLYAILLWGKSFKKTLYIESALCMGLAVATKLLSLFSLIPMFVFLVFSLYKNKKSSGLAKSVGLYFSVVLLVVLPWLLFSLVHTGNPFFPFFTNTYAVSFSLSLFNPMHFAGEIWSIFTNSPDPVSPLYLIFIPLGLFCIKKFKREEIFIALYSFFALIAWYLMPNTGGGRFVLPYLPIWSVLCVIILRYITSKKIYTFVLGLILITFSVALFSRIYVAKKVLPVVLGFESENNYLKRTLQFNFGDFYDADGNLAKILKDDDVVLVYGVHNLHYANFQYIHESWVKKGDIFNYILTQGAGLPEEFYFFRQVYFDPLTHVRLYSGGGFWEY